MTGERNDDRSVLPHSPISSIPHGAKFACVDGFACRITRYSGVVASAALFLLAYRAIRLRCLELAAALHTGVNKAAQALQLLIETGIWIILATILAAPAGVLGIIEALPADRNALVATTVKIIVAGVIAALFGTLSATALTKKRHLLRYFKER